MTPHPLLGFGALEQAGLDFDGGQPVKTLSGLVPSQLGLGRLTHRGEALRPFLNLASGQWR